MAVFVLTKYFGIASFSFTQSSILTLGVLALHLAIELKGLPFFMIKFVFPNFLDMSDCNTQSCLDNKKPRIICLCSWRWLSQTEEISKDEEEALLYSTICFALKTKRQAISKIDFSDHKGRVPILSYPFHSLTQVI